MRSTILAAAVMAAAFARPGVAAEPTFDACAVFTQADAEAVLGASAEPPVENPKARRPRVIPSCTYTASKDGKPVAATAHFRFARTPEEAQRAFEDNRLDTQTKPLIIRGADGAFWAGRVGELNVRKGATWVSLAVGPSKPAERDMEVARKAAESLVRKL